MAKNISFFTAILGSSHDAEVFSINIEHSRFIRLALSESTTCLKLRLLALLQYREIRGAEYFIWLRDEERKKLTEVLRRFIKEAI